MEMIGTAVDLPWPAAHRQGSAGAGLRDC